MHPVEIQRFWMITVATAAKSNKSMFSSQLDLKDFIREGLEMFKFDVEVISSACEALFVVKAYYLE